MIVWLELVGVLVVLALTWVWVAAELLADEPPCFYGGSNVPPPGPTQFYADAARDHPPGEEGPSPYAADVGHLLTQMAQDNARERAAEKRAAQERAVQRALARPAKILRKRDGMSLTDEASAAVYRSVFGNDPPGSP